MKVKKLCETPGTALRANRWTGTKIRKLFRSLAFYFRSKMGKFVFLRRLQFFAFQAMDTIRRCIKMFYLWYIPCLLSFAVLFLCDKTFVCPYSQNRSAIQLPFWCFPRARARPPFFVFCLHRFTQKTQNTDGQNFTGEGKGAFSFTGEVLKSPESSRVSFPFSTHCG